MKTVERSFRLEARTGLGAKPRPELIGPVLAHLHGTLQDAVRMGFLHSSRARGRIPAGIKAAADVRFLGHSAAGEGATLLRFQVAPFGEVVQELFAQASLWEDGPQANETAFELLGAALNDVGTGIADSNRYDPGLLKRIGSYRRLFGGDGLNRIVLPDLALPVQPQLDAAIVCSARELASVTPDARRVRVVGRLDLMGASQGVLKIDTGSGVAVTALWDGDAPIESFRSLFNRDVICEGLGVFRPSGSLLRIEMDALAPATRADEFFRRVPVAVARTDTARSMRLRPADPSVYAAFLGSVPAEESDEEFAMAVAELS